MKISTKGRYALRMLVDLAEHRSEGYTALKTIAERQGISKKYLEQIVPILNRTDILLTNRGFQGGYQLGREPSEITVGEVLRLTEGSLSPVACIGPNEIVNCDRSVDCPTLPIWKGLDKVIHDYLYSVTLQDIIDQSNEHFADDYMI
ncbi:MAG: Rrf2 family transcriptional regulator [Clostridiales bacterium]|nr:Rrf2 family transcriptional regulator [Clostridiales bacterium]